MLSATLEPTGSSQDALPVCLQVVSENPYRLVSLWGLLVRYAHFFFINGDMLRQAVGSLASIADQLDHEGPSDRLARYLEERYAHAKGAVKCLETLCEPLPLPVSKKAIDRMRKQMERPLAFNSIAIGALVHDLDNLSKVIGDELECLEFMPVEPTRRDYLFAEADLFGVEVAEKFPSATIDIVEAARCYALKRNTACVFHCMRILEIGLQTLGEAVGIADPRPNWEPVIAKLDKLLRMDHSHLQRNPCDALPEVHRNRDYYAGVSSYFNAVKISCRNRVMHVGIEYADEDALRILESTCGFMKHLAARLYEQ